MYHRKPEIILEKSDLSFSDWLFEREKLDKNDMKCNDPQDSPKKDKKKVVKACQDGKEKLVHYGAEGYGHNYSKKARKSFRARHDCDNQKDKLTASYWACKDLWPKNGQGDKQACPDDKDCKTDD